MFRIDPAAGLLAHHGARRVGARDRPLEVDRQQEVELALPVPAGRLARQHVRARIADPHVESTEPFPGLGDQRLTAVAGAEVRLDDEPAAAGAGDPLRDRRRPVRAVPVRHEHRRARAAERLCDGGADAAARARDDGPHPVEPAPAGLSGHHLATWVMSRADYTMRRMPRLGADAVAGAAQLACVLEASAEKPGNITPSHDFGDTTYEDMLRSGIALGPELGRAGERGVGETVLAAVRASRGVAGANTNLGIALLLAPLARAALVTDDGPLRERLRDVLSTLTVDDARDAYVAIRLAGPGGLDEPVEHDVREEPRVTLREAMAAAAQRDTIASEYVTDHAVTFELGLPALAESLGHGVRPRDAVVELALRLMAAIPDTLIARKRGAEAAGRVSAEARRVLAAGGVRDRRRPDRAGRVRRVAARGRATRSTRGPRPIS